MCESCSHQAMWWIAERMQAGQIGMIEGRKMAEDLWPSAPSVEACSRWAWIDG